MSIRMQNIGIPESSRRLSLKLQAFENVRESLVSAKAANDLSLLVGQFGSVIANAASLKPSPQRETSKQRWQRFIEEWKASYHPNPNRMLTVNFDKTKLDDHIRKGGTLSSFKVRFLDHMRRLCRRTGHPWLAAWVIEVRNKPHIHILMWLPEGSDLETQLWRWLGKRFPLPLMKGMKCEMRLPGDNSGSPVHMSTIDDTQSYFKTGRSGLDGLSDYLAKAIEPNFQRRKGRPIGRIVGRTQDLTNPTSKPKTGAIK